MSESTLEDYLILRDLDEPTAEDTFENVAKGAMAVLRDLQGEGIGIRWVKSHVRTQSDGAVVGTFCHYQAEDEAAIREHAERAGLPVTRIDRHGTTLENQ